jgi:acyl homoserine lactone synthase
MKKKIVCCGREMDSAARALLAAYRYEIFIERLGWQLPVERGFEQDAYDCPETVYIILENKDGEICGCGRLLSTTRPYMLAEVFPELLGGLPAPRSDNVWELSRFSARTVRKTKYGVVEDAINTRLMLATVVEAAMAHGATRLVTVSPIGVLRLLGRMGVAAYPMDIAHSINGIATMALWIDLSKQTCAALGVTYTEQAEHDPVGLVEHACGGAVVDHAAEIPV